MKSPEEVIRTVIDAWAEAIRQKDVEAVFILFAPDVALFDLAPPLQTADPSREKLGRWFATFRGNIGYEIRDLTITNAAEVAFAHSLNRMTGAKIDGEKVDLWFRETYGLRTIDGHWRITHLHESVPFYMDGSFKAAVDLKPA